MNGRLVQLLKQARLDSKLLQRDVAEKLGIKDNTISNWEKGRTEPDIDTFIKMCEIYGIDYAALLESAYAPTDNKDEFDNYLTYDEKKLITYFRGFNQEGQEKALDLLDDLHTSGKYIKTDSHGMAGEAKQA